jgi:hypothetical protein
VITRLVVAAVCAGSFVAGCTSSANDRPSAETTATTTGPAAPASVRPECVDVADKANELLSRVVRLANGGSTAQQVRAAADGLSDSVDEAKSAVGPEAAADLDGAGQALGRVRNALATRPVDTAGLRTAANDLLTSLGDAAAVCTPGAAATSTEDSTGTGGTPPTPSPNPDLRTPTLDPTY